MRTRSGKRSAVTSDRLTRQKKRDGWRLPPNAVRVVAAKAATASPVAGQIEVPDHSLGAKVDARQAIASSSGQVMPPVRMMGSSGELRMGNDR
jgi:hypothetical protein